MCGMKKRKEEIVPSMAASETEFAEILGIIVCHRTKALANVNAENLLTNWEIGAFISQRLANASWGSATIDGLVDYIHAHDPTAKGYGRRNLYNMAAVYEAFTSPEFSDLLDRSDRSVQPVAAQIGVGENVQPPAAQMAVADFVQPAAGQSIPPVLFLTTFTNLVEIINRVRTAQERLFYIVYAFRERLNVRDLRRAIVGDAYSALLGGGRRSFSKALASVHAAAPLCLRDEVYVDFLNLPPKHSEARLRRGIVANMKDFILSIGRDFLFMGEEFPVKVGGGDFRIDLLFYHRALRCLVAFELKARAFRPSDMGQLEFYLEALDRDVKRAEENPSIGVLLCKSADHSMVEYALSRTMSPAMVAEYKRVMIPREVLQETFDRYLGNEGGR